MAHGRSLRVRHAVGPLLVLVVLAGGVAAVQALEVSGWWTVAVAAVVAAVAPLMHYVVTPWTDRRRAAADAQRQVIQALQPDFGPQEVPRPVSEWDPLDLRVHESATLRQRPATAERMGVTADGRQNQAPDPRLPAWVERKKTAEIKPWLEGARVRGGFLLIVGESSVGKTRLAYEALARSPLREWKLLRPITADSLVTWAKSPDRPSLPALVVWLDEIQEFVEGPWLKPGSSPFTDVELGKLLGTPGPVVVIGTIWPDRLRELRSTEKDPVTGVERPRFPRANAVLTDNRRREVRLHTFDDDERAHARVVAARDPRIADALEDRDYGLTQVLAGAPWLISRWETEADPHAAAVITAAIDARRVGVATPLSESLLRAVARAYLQTPEPDDEWFAPALAYATEVRRDRAATAVFLPVADDENRTVVGYEVADYLLQYGFERRRTVRLPDLAWRGLLTQVEDPDDLFRLSIAAFDRGLLRYSEQFHLRAIAVGHPDARRSLAAMVAWQGFDAEARRIYRSAIDSGDSGAWMDLIDHAHGSGAADLEDLVREAGASARAGGDGSRELRVYLARRRWEEDGSGPPSDVTTPAEGGPVAVEAAGGGSRIAIPTDGRPGSVLPVPAGPSGGLPPAASVTAPTTADSTGTDEGPVEEPADGVELPDSAAIALGLEKAGEPQRAEAVLVEAIAAGDPRARMTLASLWDIRGEPGKAEAVLREALAAGDPVARSQLAVLWELRGDVDRAEAVLRAGIEAGEPGSRLVLANFLDEQDRPEDAETVLEEAIAAGDPEARVQLAAMWDARGELELSLAVLREGVAAGDLRARNLLAGSLERSGDPDAAEATAREGIDAGEQGARVLLALLREQRRDTDGAEAVLREGIDAGEPLARSSLAWLREERGDRAGAEEVLQEGIAAEELGAAVNFAAFLEETGQLERAEQVLRAEVEAGNADARQALAEMLDGLGDPEGADAVLREGIEAGDANVRMRLAVRMEQRGDTDAAEGLFREGIEAGEPDARMHLAVMLDSRGFPDRAEAVLREAIDMGDPGGRTQLAVWREERGDLEGAEMVFREGIAEGDLDARVQLSVMLDDRGDTERSEAVLREGIDAGEPGAWALLAELFSQRGEPEKAEPLLRAGIAAGDQGARAPFADQMALRGDFAEAEALLREGIAAGDPGCLDGLTGLLAQRRPREAEHVRRYGLTPDGSLAPPWELSGSAG